MRREPFSLLKVISLTSHGLLSLMIFLLLAIVLGSFTYYIREGQWVMATFAGAIFGFGVVVFINAWRLRLSEL